jgi:hypothetical protein
VSAPHAVRKAAQRLRKRLQEVGQAPVAAALHVDVATVSRWVSEGRVDQFGALVEELGLKLVPVTHACVNREELDHLMFWARKGLEAVRSADDLIWDDE